MISKLPHDNPPLGQDGVINKWKATSLMDKQQQLKEHNKVSMSVGKKVRELRKAMMDCVTCDDIIAMTKTMIKHGKQGDIQAVRLVWERVFGRPVDSDMNERIALIEQVATNVNRVPKQDQEPDEEPDNGNPYPLPR